MDSGDIMSLIGLQNIRFDTTDFQARPFEWDDQNNPTKIIKMHTTCPKCSQRVILSDDEGNIAKLNDIYYTYCKNCDNGHKMFDEIMKYITGFYNVDIDDYAVLETVLGKEDYQLTKQINGF